MYYGINTYEDRIRNPFLGLIDWEYVLTHPECSSKIWESYLLNKNFQAEVNRRLHSEHPLDKAFKSKFYEYFGDIIKPLAKER